VIYLKSILVGIGALILSTLLAIAAVVLVAFVSSQRSGSGGFGAVFTFWFTIGPIVLISAALIFAAGFWWEWRRLSP
jgi:hypothetical protein